MPTPLERDILVASTIIPSKDVDKNGFMYGSNFNETDFIWIFYNFQIQKIKAPSMSFYPDFISIL